MKNIQLSPNSLNLFLECPHCFWLEKNKNIKRPPDYPYSLNLSIDKILRDEFDSYRKKKTIPLILKKNNIKAHLFSNKKLLDQWRDNSVGIKYFDENLQATLVGVLDDVLEFKDGRLSILDYKSTGSDVSEIYDRFQLQLDIYTYLMEKNGYKVKDKAYLVFYVVNKIKNNKSKSFFKKEILEINISSSDIEDIFKDAVETLRKPIPPTHSRDCRFGKWLKGVRNFSI